MLRKAESVDALGVFGNEINRFKKPTFAPSPLKIPKNFPGNVNKAVKKKESEYEEIEPQAVLKINNVVRTKVKCDLCGTVEAAVKCDRCNNQAFCLSCDDMYHRHPKRSSHDRKAVDLRPINKAPLKPPLPPKVVEGLFSPPPQPPPRKNKRSGMFNSFGKIDKASGGRIRRSSVGGEILCSRPSEQDSAPNREENKVITTSVIPYMANRPLPPTPDIHRVFPTKSDNIGNLSRGNFTHQNVQQCTHPLSQVHATGQQERSMTQILSKPPMPGLQSGFTQYPPVGPRKLSLQQFPSGLENKASFIEPTPGTVPWETQPPKIPQKMRSQSISDEQWNRTVLGQNHEMREFSGNGTSTEIGEVQHMQRGYNTMGYGSRPLIPTKGMTSSASVSNLNALHGRTNSFQQMNMVPYDPNMMWMTCPHCQPQHGYQHSSTNNRGMKRAASNVSMNMSSVASDTSGYPWSMPAHVHPPMQFYPGYYPHCQQQIPQHMSMRGSATSIPDSMHSIGKTYFSPAMSERATRRSHRSTKSSHIHDRQVRSRNHSRTRSIDANDSISSPESDGAVHLDAMQAKPKSGCLSWQCHHCTFINPGHIQICSMCSKPIRLQNDTSVTRNDKQQKTKKYYRSNNKDDCESRNSDYDSKGSRQIREHRDHRTRLPSSSRSLRGWNSKNISKNSYASDSPSLSDSPFEDEQIKVEKQLKSLNLTPLGRSGIYEGLTSNFHQRTRDKQRKPEGKYKFRNRSKSASVRTKRTEKLSPDLNFSLTSTDSGDLCSDSYLPDDLDEKRISSLEENIMASILLKQKNIINSSLSKEVSDSSMEYMSDERNVEALYSTVSKRKEMIPVEKVAKKDQKFMVYNSRNSSENDLPSVQHINKVSNDGIIPEKTNIWTTNNETDNQTNSTPELSPSISDQKNLSFSIDIDNHIDYIDDSSDQESIEKANVLLLSDKTDITQRSNESSSITPKADIISNLSENDINGMNMKSTQRDTIKESGNMKKIMEFKPKEITVETRTPATYRLSPTSISSSDAQFYSPPGSPIRPLEGKYYESMDKGFETDIYADEDLVTALESLESSEEVSSGDTIHSSLDQLSFTEEVFDNPLVENETFAVRKEHPTTKKDTTDMSISKSKSDQAISAKIQIQISQQVSKIKAIKNSMDTQVPNEMLSVKEMVDQKMQEKMKQQGFQIVGYFREAERKGYNPEDVSIAMALCEEANPVEWLDENWNAMIDTVKTLATNYGVEREPNDVGIISGAEAKEGLRLHKGNIWAAVTECVEQRQKKYKEIHGKGNFLPHDIVKALEVAGGNVAEAFMGLAKINPIGKLIKKIWNSSKGEEIQDKKDNVQVEMKEISATPTAAVDIEITKHQYEIEHSGGRNETASSGVLPKEPNAREHLEAVIDVTENSVGIEEHDEEPIVVDGAKVRQHGGPVTVQKATKIVALAITKAMARESAVKDDSVTDPESINGSGRTSSISGEISSSNTSNDEKQIDESSDETPEVKDISKISEVADRSNGVESKHVRKSSIPPAVESFDGPIFIPTETYTRKPILQTEQIKPDLNMLHRSQQTRESIESAVENRIKEIDISQRIKTFEMDSKASTSQKLETSYLHLPGTSQINAVKHILSQVESDTDSDTEDQIIRTINVSDTELSGLSTNSSRAISTSPIPDALPEFTKSASPVEKIINENTNDRQKHISGGSTMESPEISDDDDMEIEHKHIEKLTGHSDDASSQTEIIDESRENTISSLESNQLPLSDEQIFVNPQIIVETPTAEEENIKELTADEKQKVEKLHFDRTVRRLLAEGHAPTYEKAELAANLLALSFEEEDSVIAAVECTSIYSAMRFLRQECELCAERYSMGKMVSMLHCIHRCCYQCANNYFTFQIKAKNIRELRCPFCNEPDLEADEEVAMDYFNNLDILLKGIIDTETHELFQRKVRDLTLMKDPNFRWCNKCSSGYIANARARKLICPDCKEVTCASCRQVWELQHEGISCEEFLSWKTDNDPESQAKGVARHLAENGIKCPKCRFTYALAKGGCMHFTCTECKFEFCSGCSQPFKQGAKCTIGPYCERLGLHAHHPRNCLFYLRDKDPQQLQQLLSDHNITFDVDEEIQCDNISDVKESCRVLEQKETLSGLKDDACGRTVLKGHAGLCNLHYVEYLVEMINNHSLDPVTIFDEADLRVCLRRNGKTVPVRRWESEKLYRNKLMKLIREQLPLDAVN